ncbi:MAG TPA: 50S ribosomal protein L21 [Patescibacteria group bacterium]|nr:50S ribosomal protein L21 [Patescibacteria group bacterium]
MFAVIRTGGKQYEVREGQELKIEKLEVEPGSEISLEVLLVADEEGKEVKLGKPLVDGASVSATIVEHGKAKKVSVVKYKPKVRYRRNVGHRQPFTKVKIGKIVSK